MEVEITIIIIQIKACLLNSEKTKNKSKNHPYVPDASSRIASRVPTVVSAPGSFSYPREDAGET